VAPADVPDTPVDAPPRRDGWRTGDDVAHPVHGHGWVQGSGHGRVTVRFETRSTGPGRAVTLAADAPELIPADPVGSLA
jgi:DNA polymerase-4